MSRDEPKSRPASRLLRTTPSGMVEGLSAKGSRGHRIDRSEILDRAYDEYCRLIDNGQAPNSEEFCGRFPWVRSSLRQLLEAHHFFEANPHFLDQFDEAHWPSIGDTFQGFTLTGELGRGTFARVFLASEPSLGDRRVVVKVSLRGGGEAETLGRLQHPGVVPVHSVREDTHSGLTAVCMPYLGCATLADVVDGVFATAARPKRASEILRVARMGDVEPSQTESPAVLQYGTFQEGAAFVGAELADALTFVHARGICHRDLKPSNVLVTPSGRPMLLDFNLSVDARREQTYAGGTIPYMAPEELRRVDQLAAQPVDFRSDLFSLGVVLFELLTGKHPFAPLPANASGDATRLLLLDRQERGAPSIRALVPDVDSSLDRVVKQCLAFRPDERPRSADAIAGPLRRVYDWRRRLRRRLMSRWRFKLVVATGIAVAGVVVWSLLPPPEPFMTNQLRLGKAERLAGRHEAAFEYLNRAVRADPKSAEAYFERGRAHVATEQYSPALSDFARALTFMDDPKLHAEIAFCAAHLVHNDIAIFHSDQAIRAGFKTAAVYNNLGYAHLRLNQREAAEASLGEAIRINPDLQTAYHNRARLDRSRISNPPGYVPLRGIEDIRTAIRLGPDSTELYFDAAYLCASAAKADPKWVEPAIDYLDEAFKRGQNPKLVRNDVMFQILKSEDRFQRLLEQPASDTPASRSPRLIEPVTD
jgi:serine/threonine protein kinase